MRPYFVSLRIEAVEASRTLTRRDREKIYRFAHSLADNPFQRLAGEDLVEHEAHGVEVGASSRASLGARRSRAARSSQAISSIEMKCSTRA